MPRGDTLEGQNHGKVLFRCDYLASQDGVIPCLARDKCPILVGPFTVILESRARTFDGTIQPAAGCAAHAYPDRPCSHIRH